MAGWTTLVQAETLSIGLARPDLVVLDCRFDLADTGAGEHAWMQAHIPGARYAHLDRDLSGATRNAAGRHPWPDAADFVERLGRWGITPQTQVVAYDADSGAFVCFEGGEGSGKSTQSRLLGDWLEAEGYAVVLTFEPGDTAVGKELRSIVLSPETGDISDRTEALLYAADKAEHVDTVVQPALDRGAVVITDRYVDSMLAYQGAGRTLDVAEVEAVARWATGDLRPHLTVVLDLAPEAGLGRFDGRDRIEGQSLEFHQRVRQGFLDLAAADPGHYAVLDARAPIDEIAASIRARVEPLLERR